VIPKNFSGHRRFTAAGDPTNPFSRLPQAPGRETAAVCRMAPRRRFRPLRTPSAVHGGGGRKGFAVDVMQAPAGRWGGPGRSARPRHRPSAVSPESGRRRSGSPLKPDDRAASRASRKTTARTHRRRPSTSRPRRGLPPYRKVP